MVSSNHNPINPTPILVASERECLVHGEDVTILVGEVNQAYRDCLVLPRNILAGPPFAVSESLVRTTVSMVAVVSEREPMLLEFGPVIPNRVLEPHAAGHEEALGANEVRDGASQRGAEGVGMGGQGRLEEDEAGVVVGGVQCQ